MRRGIRRGMVFALTGILGVTVFSTSIPAYAQSALTESTSSGSNNGMCASDEW